MFAYVPARGGSKRIPRKNVRPLGGRPLLLRVLDNLARVPGLSGIGVSSEDPEILALAEAHGGARTLGPRDAALADDQTGFLGLLRHDAPRFARAFGDDTVLFVTATAALVPPESFALAMERFRTNPTGLTIGVVAYEMSPWRSLSGDPDRGLQPVFPEMYLRPTKDVPKAYTDAGCFLAVDLRRLEGLRGLLDLKPVTGVVLPRDVGIDLDTEADWSRLEAAFHNAGNKA